MKIIDITITFDNGSTETIDLSTVNTINIYSGNFTNINALIKSLLSQLDIQQALENQGKEHDAEITNLDKQWQDKLKEQEVSLKKKYTDDLSKQRGSISGSFIEHFVPYFPEYTYNPFDVHLVGNPFDFLVLDGLETNKQINSIVFQEVKTGIHANYKPTNKSNERILMDFINNLNCPQIKYEQWAKTNNDERFYIVKR